MRADAEVMPVLAICRRGMFVVVITIMFVMMPITSVIMRVTAIVILANG